MLSGLFSIIFFLIIPGISFTFLRTTKHWTDIFMALAIQSIIIPAVNRVKRENLTPAG